MYGGCVHIYTSMLVCIYIYKYTYMYAGIYIYIDIYTQVYMCVHIRDAFNKFPDFLCTGI